MPTDRPILLVDDDAVDVMTVERAMRQLKVDVPLIVAQNGEEALRILDSGKDKPTLILLDLNMPVMSGVEFLRKVKADTVLRRIPVVVLTTSCELDDKRNCFDLSVAGYMVKPVGYPKFIELMHALDKYWTLSETA
ncbi:response regulator [Herbaspirillum sp. ST 5-3]|uniref:response regulator n=1 Tax=Oxalobacteraceae TaxID=75682 RepID=UPI0010A51CB3|nr:response regulator [Herbaspirillum sp. ST 5-3]